MRSWACLALWNPAVVIVTEVVIAVIINYHILLSFEVQASVTYVLGPWYAGMKARSLQVI